MGRKWTAAAILLATLLAGAGVASAQEERPAPAQQVERQRSPDPVPAPAPPPPVTSTPSQGFAAGTPAESRPASAWRMASFNADASGQATARPRTGGSSASSGSGGRRGSSASSGGGDSQGRRRQPGSVSSGPSGGNRSGGTWGGSSSGSSAERRRYPYRNPDGSVTTGYAVPRGSVRPPYGGGGWYYPSHPYYGYWYPYGYGSWGLGFYMWDPYWYGGWGWPGYGYGYGYSAAYYDTGAVRTLVKPRDAQVFVDGYYVGVVDEFDGTFQRLRLDTGPHRIEIRKEGFETLRFDVRVTFDHTITLRGELKPAVETP